MKKIFCILVILCLCACGNKTKELSVVVPSGAPSLAFYNEIDNPNFNTSDAKSILGEIRSDSGSDILVLDSVNGIKAINENGNYKLASIITFGNFYIASTGIDEDGVMDESDYIVLFSSGATPDIIFHYLYGNKYDNNIHYVTSVSDAAACLIKGINIMDDEKDINDQPYVEYVMIAEPALSQSLSKNSNAFVYEDIQKVYREKTGLDMIQAALFVSNRLSDDEINLYLNNLENDVNDLLSNAEVFKNAIQANNISDEELKDIFGVASTDIVNKVLEHNTIGLGYKDAYAYKEEIDKFVALFSLDETDEEIYYK